MTTLKSPRWFEGVMYTAYGDESADETQQRVFALAGLFGSKSDWSIFRDKWRRRTGGMIFHAAECDSDKGEYEHIDHHINKKLYKDLTNIIAESKLVGHAIAISLPDYKELLVPALDENPYYICFHSLLINLAKRAARCIPQDHIKFIFDRNVQIEHNASALYDYTIRWGNSDFRKLMADEIGFATRKTIGIQAADLVAREAMKLLDNRIGPVKRATRLSTQVLRANKLIWFKVYDRAWCERMLRDSEDAQYDRTEYFDWLKEHRLNDTLPHRLRYEASHE